jgi:hypothetical protein
LFVVTIFIVLLTLPSNVPADHDIQHQVVEVTVAQQGTESGAFRVPQWTIFFGALFPDMDAGDIGLEASWDGGSNYYPVVDQSTGTDAVLVSSGSDPCFVDFSPLVSFAHRGPNVLLRFTCAAQNTAAVTITVVLRG